MVEDRQTLNPDAVDSNTILLSYQHMLPYSLGPQRSHLLEVEEHLNIVRTVAGIQWTAQSVLATMFIVSDTVV